MHAEIQAIVRQITASVTFLPVIEEKCKGAFYSLLCCIYETEILEMCSGAFNILVYTDKDTEVPTQWKDDKPHLISGTAEQVKLRSFSTNIHKVDTLVAYRLGEDQI